MRYNRRLLGTPLPGQNLWQALLGIDHRQHNTSIDAITQAQLLMHNREIKTANKWYIADSKTQSTYITTDNIR